MMRFLVAVAALCLALTPGLAAAGEQPPVPQPEASDVVAQCRPALFPRQRYGFVTTNPSWAQVFDVARLNAGWASNLTVGPAAPGMNRSLVLRTTAGYCVNPALLGPIVDANPGAIWLIGNEPDCIWQDNVFPAEYARIYHDLYVFLKARDAGARVAPGGIVQPSPLRLEYLDLVLNAYRARYGSALPADLWHIHNAILPETSCEARPLDCWGAEIPPGVEDNYGVQWGYEDNDNLDIFSAQVWTFRQWMADSGYGDLPLVVSEFGILMPVELGFDVERVSAFMSATFAFLATAADSKLGDPLDGGRLVQRWAWFSLDVPAYDPETAPGGFNGNLFDPDTSLITDYGLHYAELTAALAPLDYAELALVRWQVPHVPPPQVPGGTVTVPVTVRLGNGGTSASGPFAVRLEYSGPRNGSLQLLLRGVPAYGSEEVTFMVSDLVPGVYDVHLTIDVLNQVAEPTECDNQATRQLLVPAHVVYVPLVGR